MQMQINSFCIHAESRNLITFVVFLFQFIENCNLAPTEKMENIVLRAVIHYLRLKGFSQGAPQGRTGPTGGEGAPSCSTGGK